MTDDNQGSQTKHPEQASAGARSSKKQSEPDYPELTIEFDYDASDRQLYGAIVGCHEKVNVSEKWFKNTLKEKKYDNLYILEKNVKRLLTTYDSGRKIRVKIAEARDAEASIAISEDGMEATVTITQCFGGKAVSPEDITTMLERNGVVEGVDEALVTQAAKIAPCEEVVVAKGKEPENGIDARFECLVKECYFKGPQENTDGKVDFFDLQEFVVIESGIPLMRRFPPTSGSNGFNVHGQAIPATPGEDTPFKETEGAVISADDPALLVSTTKGHPVVFIDGVEVDETMALPTVDLSTGNVTFDGSLHVTGDINDNMLVDVTGNVMVDGVIQKAKVIAGGDIIVKNGVIGGQIQQLDDEQEDNIGLQFGAQLIAVGDINARFIDNAFLQAGNTIWIREYIRHSQSFAGRFVYLGKQGGKGHLIGGKTTATKGVEAKILGTAADVNTVIQVGIAPELRDQYDELSHDIFQHNQDLSGLITTFTHLKEKSDNPEETNDDIQKKVVNIAQTIRDILHELDELNNKRNDLEARMSQAKNSYVKVNTKAFRNVMVKIKDASFKVKDSCRSGSFTLNGKRISFDR